MKTLATIAAPIALIGNVSMANAQTNGTSKNTSTYVAGKGKYCKESRADSLDCFYASLDACQRHNNSSNLPCVPNRNSGTYTQIDLQVRQVRFEARLTEIDST